MIEQLDCKFWEIYFQKWLRKNKVLLALFFLYILF